MRTINADELIKALEKLGEEKVYPQAVIMTVDTFADQNVVPMEIIEEAEMELKKMYKAFPSKESEEREIGVTSLVMRIKEKANGQQRSN